MEHKEKRKEKKRITPSRDKVVSDYNHNDKYMVEYIMINS